MAVTISLKRVGAKNRPFYRIIVSDKRDKGTGNVKEFLGWYNPLTENNELKIEEERYRYWISKGAEVSETVRTLLRKKGIVGSVKNE